MSTETMTDGIKKWVVAAVDTMDDTAQRLIDGGVEPKEAVKAAAIMTKKAVADSLDEHLGNLSAAHFTRALRTQKDHPLAS